MDLKKHWYRRGKIWAYMIIYGYYNHLNIYDLEDDEKYKLIKINQNEN